MNDVIRKIQADVQLLIQIEKGEKCPFCCHGYFLFSFSSALFYMRRKCGWNGRESPDSNRWSKIDGLMDLFAQFQAVDPAD